MHPIHVCETGRTACAEYPIEIHSVGPPEQNVSYITMNNSSLACYYFILLLFIHFSSIESLNMSNTLTEINVVKHKNSKRRKRCTFEYKVPYVYLLSQQICSKMFPLLQAEDGFLLKFRAEAIRNVIRRNNRNKGCLRIR